MATRGKTEQPVRRTGYRRINDYLIEPTVDRGSGANDVTACTPHIDVLTESFFADRCRCGPVKVAMLSTARGFDCEGSWQFAMCEFEELNLSHTGAALITIQIQDKMVIAQNDAIIHIGK